MSSSVCDRCDGCGYISNITGKPWNHYVGSDMDQTDCVVEGQQHYARTCSKCNGVGSPSRTSEDAVW